jgi:hypothetical protein
VGVDAGGEESIACCGVEVAEGRDGGEEGG